MPILNQKTAAFRAGQALNQFAWHAEQAVILPQPLASEHQTSVEAAMRNLTANAIQAANEQGVDAVREVLKVAAEDLTATINSEHHADLWTAWHTRLEFVLPFDEVAERTNAYEELLRPVWIIVRNLRVGLFAGSGLDEECREAFRLGQIIDADIRPDDVHQHVYFTPEESELSNQFAQYPWGPPPAPVTRARPPPAKHPRITYRVVQHDQIAPPSNLSGDLAAQWSHVFGTELR